MKGLHEMKKAHQALTRYLNLDVATLIETFKGFVSDDSGSFVTVPYQQNLDYILIRMQGLSKLMIRVVSCTKRSANYFLGLIKAGSFYARGVVFLSTLGSVWSLSREFCKSIVEQYNKLKVFREILVAKPGVKWVDGDYELPEALETWIGHEYSTLITNETYDARLLIKEIEIDHFLENNGENIFNSMRVIKIERHDEVIKEDVKEKTEIKEEFELEDVAPIPRTPKEKCRGVNTTDHSRSPFSSKESISNFIKNETLYRKVHSSKSLTINKIKKKVWKEFKDDIKTKAILMQDGAFIEYVKDYLDEYKVIS